MEQTDDRARLQAMVAAVEAYPLCTVKVPARFGPPVPEDELRALEAARGVALPEALRRFYRQMDGFVFFWHTPRDVSQELVDAYCAAEPNEAWIDWELVHGMQIPPVRELLAGHLFPIGIPKRPPEVLRALAGDAPSEAIEGALHPLDWFERQGSEECHAALLLLPGIEGRVVAVTDSGMVDPARPWMSVRSYLDLIIATAGERGMREGLVCMNRRPPPGEWRIPEETLALWRRSLLRPLSEG